MPELLCVFLKQQACIKYCFRGYIAYVFPSTLQARFQAFKA